MGGYPICVDPNNKENINRITGLSGESTGHHKGLIMRKVFLEIIYQAQTQNRKIMKQL